MGTYELRYQLVGTKEAGGVKDLEFSFGTSNRPVFYGIIAVLVLLNALLAKLALGNQGRRWAITVVPFDKFALKMHSGYRTLRGLGKWNWWKKRILVSLADLDKTRGWKDRLVEVSGSSVPSARMCWKEKGSDSLLRDEVPGIGFKFRTLVRPRPRAGEDAQVGIFVDTTSR
ncbi:MAG: hypothetical protein KDL87_19280, partial [Verrucomicrobiae bacterium]|nr:hypothetical protein [Verrucomicrobiae bacterium]